MTEQQARDLRPGDRVRLTDLRGHHGTIRSTDLTHVTIQWDAGGIEACTLRELSDVTPDPEKTHD